jgi:hypothetical protein
VKLPRQEKKEGVSEENYKEGQREIEAGDYVPFFICF